MPSRKRIIAGVVASLATLLTAGALLVPDARAEVLDATCTGRNTTHYDPGVNNIPQTITIQGVISLDCVSLNPAVPVLLKGRISGGGSGTLSCILLQQPTSGASTVEWTTTAGSPIGASTFDYSTSLSPGTNGTTILTVTGNVTSGLFAGDSIVIVTTYLTFDFGACSTPEGLTSRTGAVAAAFTNL